MIRAPEVSVIMSTYSRNRAEGGCPNLLKRAIDSILAQEFTNFELVLMDDGSVDGSQAVCLEYAKRDSRVRYFRSEVNSGIPAKKYNEGMLLSHSPLITFMFDDDFWYPNALMDLYKAIQYDFSEYQMIYGLIDYYDIRTRKIMHKNFGGEWDWEKLNRSGNFLCNNSVIVRREVINDVGGYDEAPIIKRLCDWDLWWRIGRKFKVKRIEKVLGEVFAFNSDSIGNLIPLNISNIRERQAEPRLDLPLKGRMGCKLRFAFVHSGLDEALLRWRVWYLSDALKMGGFESIVVNAKDPRAVEICTSYDCVVFYRITDIFYLDLLKTTIAAGKVVIYDIDDFIFENDGFYSNSPSVILNYMNKASIVSGSTKTLTEQMPKGKLKIVRENAIDIETFSILSSPQKDDDVFRIGWLAGIGRTERREFVLELVNMLGKKYKKSKIEFWYTGEEDDFTHRLKKSEIKIVVIHYEKPCNWKELYRKYNAAKFDVIINPLVDSVFMNCKSHLKFIEATALGVPLIVSPTSTFLEIVEHRVSGFLATTTSDFLEEVSFVKNHKDKAKQVVDKARVILSDRFMISSVLRKFVMDVVSNSNIKNPSSQESRVIAQELIEVVRKQEGQEKKKVLIKENIKKEHFIYETNDSMDIRKVSPALLSSRTLELNFNSPVDILEEISLFGATFSKKITESVSFHLFCKDKMLCSGNIRPIEDNQWWVIKFLDEIHGYYGRTLTLKLKNKSKHAIAFYLSDSDIFSQKVDVSKINYGSLALRISGWKS